MDIFYLKYRPKTVAELDSRRVRERLKKILREPVLPHCFLFAGPKGTGKTSAARILAKALNCPQAKEGNPCGRCDICLEIERGESLDVLEIDAASNRGIDDIRELKDKISFQPLKAKNKVYIIDEVHMLTREAFNAILKTLEEPPAHVYFIFCTTNPEKIPPTVLSRLTTIEFNRAGKEEILSALERVIKGEKIKLNKEVLSLIAEVADGSFRDAHKIFYQLWLESGGEISEKEARQFLGRLNEGRPRRWLYLLGQGKLKESLVLLDQLAERGVDFNDYCRRLLLLLKEVILAHFGGGSEEKEKKVLAACFPLPRAIFLSRQLMAAAEEQKKAVLSQLPLQLAAVEFFERFFSGGEREKEKKNLSPQVTSQEEGKMRKEFSPSEKKEEKKKPEEGLFSRWEEVLAAVKPMNHSVSALLRSCRPLRVENNCLVLEVFYPFHRERLSEEKNRRILEAGLEAVFGSRWSVRYVLGRKKENQSPSSTTNSSSKNNSSEDELYQIAKEIFGE